MENSNSNEEDEADTTPNEESNAQTIDISEEIININGSGIWEKSENRRWTVVDTNLHRIPSRRNRATSEGSLDPSLSITSFVTNFEVEEEQPSNYRVISDGNSYVRIDTDNAGTEEEIPEAQEDDPMEGTSGSQQTRRVNARTRRRSSNVSSPEQILPPQEPDIVSSRGRRRRRRGKRKKVFVFSEDSVKKRKKWKREIIASVESSPGRDSPSPDTLNRIIQRGLVELLPIMENFVESSDQVQNQELSRSLDKVDKSDEGNSLTEDK